MEKITVGDLLNRIKDRNQPKAVFWEGDSYQWDEDKRGYYSRNFTYSILTRIALNLTDRAVSRIVFEVDDYVLDEVERDYLRAVLKPFRKCVQYIEKRKFGGEDLAFLHVRMKDGDSLTFPNFKAAEMYVDMEFDRRYSMKELKL